MLPLVAHAVHPARHARALRLATMPLDETDRDTHAASGRTLHLPKNRNDYDFRWCRFVDPSGDLAHWVTLLTEYLYLGLGYFVLQIIDGRLEEVTVLV